MTFNPKSVPFGTGDVKSQGKGIPRHVEKSAEEYDTRELIRLEKQALENRDGPNTDKPQQTAKILEKVYTKGKPRRDWDLRLHEIVVEGNHPQDRANAAHAYITGKCEEGLRNAEAHSLAKKGANVNINGVNIANEGGGAVVATATKNPAISVTTLKYGKPDAKVVTVAKTPGASMNTALQKITNSSATSLPLSGNKRPANNDH